MPQQALKCPIPANEAQRLEAVRAYDVLDTPPELDFDALTRVAAHVFSTPAAVVGLMDSDRLWFKSRLGLDVPQLDRQIAFCAYAVMRPDEPLIVEDLSKDPRFMHNPLVTQAPHLRFYAGAPLVDPNGHALGTIAVVDSQPRTLDNGQIAVLKDLSTLVITALENRRRALLLGRLALTDHLTGLANRAQFDRTLDGEIAHATRTGEPFSVLYMDLDGFKDINDRFGHLAGDEVLREIGCRLAAEVRAEDAVARFGGDEFGMVVRSAAPHSPQALAQRVAEIVSAPIPLSGGETVQVGISVGLATFGDGANSAAALLDQADRALYQAKRRSGRR
jgi:diguanylate cyclase (GGDEF)-like protein